MGIAYPARKEKLFLISAGVQKSHEAGKLAFIHLPVIIFRFTSFTVIFASSFSIDISLQFPHTSKPVMYIFAPSASHKHTS